MKLNPEIKQLRGEKRRLERFINRQQREINYFILKLKRVRLMHYEYFVKQILEMEEFSPRERGIIKKRFGFEDGDAHTLEDVGKQFGVTRDRIRQIESKALAKIKYYNRK